MTGLETITSPAVAAKRRYVSEEKDLQILAHERQKIFYSYFASMQIMFYVHTQFGRKIDGKLYWGNYHKITALKVVSRVKPCKSYWNVENLFFS